MIFVSYSHLDKIWLDRFRKMTKPLEKYVELKVWSDTEIASGTKWRDEIDKALSRAIVAVLLVSINFLSSDFILDEELPFILAAARKHKLTVLWIKLTPCRVEVTPLQDIQAAAGVPDALNSMSEYGWMAALDKVGSDIDAILKKLETPVINTKLRSRPVKRKETDLQILAKPAWRETEVLIYPGNGFWYSQGRISPGKTKLTCWFGTEKTHTGSILKIIAITRPNSPLSPNSKHPNLPLHRTRSEEVTVKRA
jgi:hypothetical protein